MTPTPEPQHRGSDDPARETATVERTGVLADDPTGPPTVPEQRRHALVRLRGLESATLAPLVRMSPLPEGVALSHRLPVDSVTLASLRAVAPLRAGHVLTVALAVAEALVDLDEHGLAHGGVSADQVVAGPDGAVLLAGCGLAWRRPPGDVDGPRAIDDVAALGEMVRDLLGAGSSPSSLVLAALRAADPDPALRPTPLELTALLRRCGRADPLLDLLWDRGPRPERDAAVVERLDRGAPPAEVPRTLARGTADPGAVVPGPVARRSESSSRGSVPPRPVAPRRPVRRDRRTSRRRGGPWLIVLVSVLAALALGAVRVGALALADGPGEGRASSRGAGGAASPEATSTASHDPTAAPMSSDGTAADAPADGSDAESVAEPPADAALDLDRGAGASGPDWRALLAAADSGRQAAISTGDATALATWVDPDGSAWAADAALAERVRSLGAGIDGGALVVLDVRPRRVTGSEAVLLVEDRRDSYTVTTSAGTRRVPTRAPRWWQVTLRISVDADGTAAWRVREVEPAAAP